MIETRIERGVYRDVFPIRHSGRIELLRKRENAGQKTGLTFGRLVAPCRYGSRGWKKEARHEPEQSRLPRSVETQKAIDVARVEGEICVSEECLLTIPEAELLYPNISSPMAAGRLLSTIIACGARAVQVRTLLS